MATGTAGMSTRTASEVGASATQGNSVPAVTGNVTRRGVLFDRPRDFGLQENNSVVTMPYYGKDV